MSARGSRNEPPTAFGGIDPPRNFTISTEDRVRALSIGAPAYAERKRRIEDAEATWVNTLLDVHEAMTAAGQGEAAILAALRKKAHTFDFARINALVDKHNRYYPIEANLALDMKTGGYLLFGRPWRREAPFDAERIVRSALAIVAERAESAAEAT